MTPLVESVIILEIAKPKEKEMPISDQIVETEKETFLRIIHSLEAIREAVRADFRLAIKNKMAPNPDGERMIMERMARMYPNSCNHRGEIIIY